MDEIKRKTMTIRIREDLSPKLKKRAIDENRTVSDIFNELIEKYLKSKNAL